MNATTNKTAHFLSGPRGPVLDLMRIAAALTVFWHHAQDVLIPHAPHPERPGNWAHAAVVVFFVLSGYVVCGSQRSRHALAADYARARLTRLCSITLPAIGVTLLVDVLVAWLSPGLHAEYARPQPALRYLLASCFMNECWWFSAAPAVNRPLWSLGFEFFYYAIYGLWVFKPGGKAGYLWPALGCLLAGPKILVMMPIWLAGVAVCQINRPALRISTAWILSAAMAVLALALITYLPPFPGLVGSAPFFFAGQYVTDWAVGVAIALAVWLIPGQKQPGVGKAVPWAGQKLLRTAGDLTFSVYVLHNPLLILFRSLSAHWAMNPTVVLMLGASVVLFVSATVGLWLEARRAFWLKIYDRGADAMRCLLNSPEKSHAKA